MTDTSVTPSKNASTRWVEAGLALFTAGLGALVMYGSYESGIGWTDTGPASGYFPFYIGLLLCAASLANLMITAVQWRRQLQPFVTRAAFGRVLQVFIPIAVFVASMPLIGIYLASVLFIAWFMWRDRQRSQPYSWRLIVAVSVGAALASYLIFALWFKVPLDAGPLGDLAQAVKPWLRSLK